MKETLDPTQQSTCMKCRSAPARYYGKWAKEGLCRPCILGMPPDIRAKVLRDMDPADRSRWQIDALLSPAEGPRHARGAPAQDPTEREVEAILKAVEKGSEEEVQSRAAKIGAKTLVSGGDPGKK